MSNARLALVCVLLLVSGCRTPPLRRLTRPWPTSPPIRLTWRRLPLRNLSTPGRQRCGAGRRGSGQMATPSAAAGNAPVRSTCSETRRRPAVHGRCGAGCRDSEPGVPGSKRRPTTSSGPPLPRSTEPPLARSAPPLQKFELTIPEAVPGSETPLVRLPAERAERDRSRRSALSATAPAARGARAAARPERPPVHAGGPPTTRGRQQSGTAPGGLRCRSGQGALDTGRHLSQPDDRLRDRPQRQQHGHWHAKGSSSIK